MDVFTLQRDHLYFGCSGSKYKRALEEKVQNIYTIYNGVDINKVTSASTNTDLREHNKRYVLIMVARYTYQKDQDTLIRAMALLPKEDYELWLVGDGERRSILENLCKELNVDDRVRFWGLGWTFRVC